MSPLRIGIVDTGVNAWHSHVRGRVRGCRIFAGTDGRIGEDDDFRDLHGHGTAVAGILREAFPRAELYAVRVFGAERATYPSLVARGLLRAAAAGCEFVNVSIAVPGGPDGDALADACSAIVAAGTTIVAPTRANAEWLPASLPGVHAVVADARLAPHDVRELGEGVLAACGRPRDLSALAPDDKFAGASFASARALAHLVRRRLAAAAA